MNRTESLIKGLMILRQYGEPDAHIALDCIHAGPTDHTSVSDYHALQLNDLGWYTHSESLRWAIIL